MFYWYAILFFCFGLYGAAGKAPVSAGACNYLIEASDGRTTQLLTDAEKKAFDSVVVQQSKFVDTPFLMLRKELSLTDFASLLAVLRGHACLNTFSIDQLKYYLHLVPNNIMLERFVWLYTDALFKDPQQVDSQVNDLEQFLAGFSRNHGNYLREMMKSALTRRDLDLKGKSIAPVISSSSGVKSYCIITDMHGGKIDLSYQDMDVISRIKLEVVWGEGTSFLLPMGTVVQVRAMLDLLQSKVVRGDVNFLVELVHQFLPYVQVYAGHFPQVVSMVEESKSRSDSGLLGVVQRADEQGTGKEPAKVDLHIQDKSMNVAACVSGQAPSKSSGQIEYFVGDDFGGSLLLSFEQVEMSEFIKKHFEYYARNENPGEPFRLSLGIRVVDLVILFSLYKSNVAIVNYTSEQLQILAEQMHLLGMNGLFNRIVDYYVARVKPEQVSTFLEQHSIHRGVVEEAYKKRQFFKDHMWNNLSIDSDIRGTIGIGSDPIMPELAGDFIKCSVQDIIEYDLLDEPLGDDLPLALESDDLELGNYDGIDSDTIRFFAAEYNEHTRQLKLGGDHVCVSDLAGLNNARFAGLVGKVQNLFLGGNCLCFLPPQIFARFPELEQLDLSRNELSDVQDLFGKGAVHLGMEHVSMLSLAGNTIVSLPIGVFTREKYPHLRLLDLSNNGLTDTSVQALCSLSFLDVLSIQGNDLSEIGQQEVEKAFAQAGKRLNGDPKIVQVFDEQRLPNWAALNSFKSPNEGTSEVLSDEEFSVSYDSPRSNPSS